MNSLWGLVLLYVAVNLPFTIWLLYGFVLQVPVELEEAAAIDGAGPVRIFTSVLLPLIGPGLAAAAIFTFRIAWNEFILALVLTDRQTRTLPVAASLFITDMGVDWGRVMAMGSLIAIPPLIFTFAAARQIITGLTAGAVKGWYRIASNENPVVSNSTWPPRLAAEHHRAGRCGSLAGPTRLRRFAPHARAGRYDLGPPAHAASAQREGFDRLLARRG